MIFTRAILRLTVAFTSVQLVLFAAFAFSVYLFVTARFDFDPTEGGGPLNSAEQGFTTLRTALLVTYGVLLVVIPLTSYWMARIALLPVKRGYDRQERFVDGASHEFRTPLSIMQGELELVTSRRRTPGEYEAAIEIALESIDDLTHLTNDLLLLATTHGTFPAVATTRVKLNTIVIAAVRPDHTLRDAHSATVVLALGTDSILNVSRPLLLRAIVNVVDNALKFTPEDGIVTVSTRRVGGAAVVTVSDTGAGMTDAETAHAFERFWRADSARDRPGHGIGLALVRQVMEAHGGRVAIASVVDVGTTVSLHFPPADG